MRTLRLHVAQALFPHLEMFTHLKGPIKVKKFAQHRLQGKQFDRVRCGLTVQQFYFRKKSLNFAAQQSDCAAV
jgi:hypothetical protein